VLTAGTGGTITGVARKLKEKVKACASSASIRSARSSPAPVRSGRTRSKASATTSSPDVLDRNLVDEWVKTEDRESFLMARRLIRQEGTAVRRELGLRVWAAKKVAERLGPGSGSSCSSPTPCATT
jgi:cystathionine beta-synthase